MHAYGKADINVSETDGFYKRYRGGRPVKLQHIQDILNGLKTVLLYSCYNKVKH